MALFGAPIAHEDHAQRACWAALHLRDAVRDYANEVRVRHGVPFGVRIGLNSGAVVVGRIGDDLRMDYTAQGHVVGLAQRMEALADSGHICLSEHTARLVEGYFQLKDLGRTRVKGVSEPVGLFDLEGAGSFRTRLDRSRARGLSTFVGRDRDMAVLEAALERARTGGGQVVGVTAEAGTGKVAPVRRVPRRLPGADISTWGKSGHFYFVLTTVPPPRGGRRKQRASDSTAFAVRIRFAHGTTHGTSRSTGGQFAASSKHPSAWGDGYENELDRRVHDGRSDRQASCGASADANFWSTAGLPDRRGGLCRHERVPYRHTGHRSARLHRSGRPLLFRPGNERVRLFE